MRYLSRRMRSLACVSLVAGLTAVAGCAQEQERQPEAPATRSAQSPTGAAPSPDGTPSPSRTSSPTADRATGTVVETMPSRFGPMLFDRTGQAIYLFDKEPTKRARCYGACAEAWPPVLTEGAPRAAGRTRQGLLGTTTRRNGTTQVTYAGHPLYFYAHEGKNEVLCHNITEFGGLWLVVTPQGAPAD